MKKVIFIIIICFLLAGCHSDTKNTEAAAEPSEKLSISNPWKSYDSLEDATSVCGLLFPLPETVAESYIAESYRVMNNTLLEVIYRDKDLPQYEVIVRMQAGEGQDLSGVYENFDSIITQEMLNCTVTTMSNNNALVQLIFKEGFSFSLYAPNRYWGDSNEDFLAYFIH